MKTLRMFLVAGLGLAVTACTTVDVPTRNAPFESLPNSTVSAPTGYDLLQTQAVERPQAATGHAVIPHQDTVTRAAASDTGTLNIAPGTSPVRVNSVTVVVPRSLKVSERNSYLPRGDIVWREDPIGDRHAQVQKIVQDAMVRGVSALNGPVSVDLEIVVSRFHALTEKARYTTGGVHAITFDVILKDPATGAQLTPPRTVRADLEEFGGQQAIIAMAQGQTQKVRITDHLAWVIQQELTNPEGYKNASLGFIQLLNHI